MIDVAIIGAGAAGLATAIFLRRLAPSRSVVLFDGAKVPGAKILVSGGTRCNVTNASVSETDFWGGSKPFVRRVLRALPVDDTVRFFEEIGVALHEEADGKLFPDSNRARDVRDALLRELQRVGVELRTSARVTAIGLAGEAFEIATPSQRVVARRVVLATGGQSLPKTGSDGTGFRFAARLGHTLVPTTPGLVPLLLEDQADAIHRTLTGVAHPAELRLWIDERLRVRLDGSLLWTHFGISGPVALNMSRHWLRAQLEGHSSRLTLSFFPGADFELLDRQWQRLIGERPRASIHTALSTLVPSAVSTAVLACLTFDSETPLASLQRESRRRLIRALLDWPLLVTGSRGYSFAEVTAGGISLDEVEASTLQSRICDRLYLVGEILDVDGRIGGFNFQWAWSSAYVAARALARESH